MARITVEDCLEKIPNRFDLIIDASERARKISIEGAEPLVPKENDKSTVIALREIAEGKLEEAEKAAIEATNTETEEMVETGEK